MNSIRFAVEDDSNNEAMNTDVNVDLHSHTEGGAHDRGDKKETFTIIKLQ